jgi:hypothetical protein
MLLLLLLWALLLQLLHLWLLLVLLLHLWLLLVLLLHFMPKWHWMLLCSQRRGRRRWCWVHPKFCCRHNRHQRRWHGSCWRLYGCSN